MGTHIKQSINKKISYFFIALLPFITIFSDPKFFWVYNFFILFVIILEEKVIATSKRHHGTIVYLVIPLIWTIFFSINDSFYYIIQAFFYLSSPFLFCFLGMQIGRISNKEQVYKFIIYSGTVIAFYFSILAFNLLGFELFFNPTAIREVIIWPAITSVLTLIIMFFSERYGMKLIKKKGFKLFIYGINLLSIYLTASRTYYLLLLIFLFIFLYQYKKKYFIGAGLLTVFFLYFLLNSQIDSIVINKIKSAGTEMALGDYSTDKEINTKYRGFETARALMTYLEGTNLNLIFGNGFEKQVDLGTYVMLAGSYWRVIPVWHNGYLYLLIKQGALGLLFYLIFFIKVIKIKHKGIGMQFFNLIIIGSLISLMVSNFIVSAFFSTEMSILWVLIGVYVIHAKKSLVSRNDTSNNSKIINV